MKLQKETDVSLSSALRWYDDACGIAQALEFVGERWALLVVRELMFGPRRFSELRTALPGISAKVLTQRLEGLEDAGIVVRRTTPVHGNSKGYDLTNWGRGAESAMMQLGRWAVQSPRHDPTLNLSPASSMLSLRTMIDRELARARGDRMRLAFRFPGDAFVAELADGELSIRRGETEEADVTLTTDPVSLGALIFGKAPVADLQAAGVLAAEGDIGVADRFVELFAMPEKVVE